MKKFILVFIVLSFSCTQQKVDKIEEKNKIISVIENETKTFYKKDFNLWSQNFVQKQDLHWVCVESKVLLRANGWNDLSKFVKQWMTQNPEPIDYESAKFEIKNLSTTIKDSIAFVKFNYINQNKNVSENNTIESRTLVKEKSNWKIISMTSYPNITSKGGTENIFLYNTTAN